MSTKPDSIALLEILKERLKLRSEMLSAVRGFFRNNAFIETETPVAVDAPAPEEYIEAPSCGKLFLRTSPELQMKQLLAAGFERIYQIGPCFREGEHGRRHRTEFTMLEWYQTGIDYMEILDFTRRMLLETVEKLSGKKECYYQGKTIDFSDWEILTVNEAFEKHAGISGADAAKKGIFEEILVEKVEPSLSRCHPVVLRDYPEEFCAFAKLKKDKDGKNFSAERWELYLGGIEIANAYSELIDPAEQRHRFEIFSKTREKLGMKKYPEPKGFLEAVDYGISKAAGCALGIDRLAMILSDASDISEVIFPRDWNIKNG